MKTHLNHLLNFLPGRWPRFNTQSKVTDSQPYRLWELPRDMRRKLGTNSTANDARSSP